MKNDELISKGNIEEIRKLKARILELEARQKGFDDLKIQSDFIKRQNDRLSSENKSLKDENDSLKEISADLKGQVDDLKSEKKDLKDQITDLKETIRLAKAQLIEEKIMTKKAVDALFGRSSEKTKSLAVSTIEETLKNTCKKEDDRPSGKRGRKKGTRDFSSWDSGFCEKDEEEYRLEGKDLICPDCGEMLKSDGYRYYHKVTVVKSYLRLTKIKIAKYVCPNCLRKAEAINPNGDCFNEMALTPSLASYLCLLNGGLYLPYQRMSDLFSYANTPISKELISRYSIRTAAILKSVYDSIREGLAKGCSVLHFDETEWNNLEADKPKVNRIWVMTSGEKEKIQATYYYYSDSRKYENFEKMAEGFSQTIVTDSYGAYFSEYKHALCWSHLRRYLVNYLKANGCKESKDYQEIAELFRQCNGIFVKERELCGLEDKDRLEKRKSELKPLIDNYFSTCEKYYDPDRNDSKNKAIQYGLKNKKLYYTLVDDSKVPLTNNLSERNVRKAVLKRASSLFSVSKEGAETTCIILTVVQSARMNGLSPEKYIEYVLNHHEDLKDPSLVSEYLPFSDSLPDDLRFTKEEKAKAEREINEENKNKSQEN